MRPATVRRCTDTLAESDGVRPGEPAGYHPVPRRSALPGHLLIEDLREPHRPEIAAPPSPSEPVAGKQFFPEHLSARQLKIGPQLFRQFAPGDTLLLLDELFDRGERVRDHRQSGPIDSHIVVHRTAMGNIQPLFQRPVRKQIQQQFRLVPILV